MNILTAITAGLLCISGLSVCYAEGCGNFEGVGQTHVADKPDFSQMKNELTEFVKDKDARIGIAFIVNGIETVTVNGEKDFPMMSVFKFPLALVVCGYVDEKGSDFNEIIEVVDDELKRNTYSPMLEKYGGGPLRLTLRELLEWSLKESDNNAADILIKYSGGIEGINSRMRLMNFPQGIAVGASEDDMHRNPYLIYVNRSTPLAMAELFDRFDRQLKNSSASFAEIAEMMEECKTGTDRLPAALTDFGDVIGHKTGTGDSLTPGRISAINDCGYVNLKDGRHYSVAVFIADSAYDMAGTSALIARISEIIYKSITGDERDDL